MKNVDEYKNIILELIRSNVFDSEQQDWLLKLLGEISEVQDLTSTKNQTEVK